MTRRTWSARAGVLLVGMLALTGASTAGDVAAAPQAALAGTSWQLVRFEGGDGTVLTPDDRAKYTLAFEKDGNGVAMRLDCNRGRGTWSSSGVGQVQFGPMAVTRAMCPPGSLHDQIVRQWGNIRSYVIRDGHLFLSLMADGGTYEYEPAAGAVGAGSLPDGFTPLFNGRDTEGWHWSGTVHHGTTALARVDDGVLILEPRPYGQGGLLLTDKVYRDFELYLEALPDPGFNSGIFLRSSEGGSAYQIELVRPGNTGALLGEQMRITAPEYIGPRTDINTVWKDGEWNSMRIRMEGEAPHITLWINGTKMWEVRTPNNDQVAGIYGGRIGLQLHWTSTYTSEAAGLSLGLPWLVQRFRNLGIRELN